MKVKKIFIIIILFFYALAISSNNFSNQAYASWNDCPKGMINDEAPGSCPMYIDTDENGICDHSEPAPEDRETTEKIDNNTFKNEDKNNSSSSSKNQIANAIDTNILAILSVLAPLTIIIIYIILYRTRQDKKK